MNITQKIIQFEWLRLKKSGLFKSLIMVLVIFLTAAFYTGVRQDQFRKNSIQFIQDKEQKSHNEFKSVVAELERKNEEFKGNGHRDPSSPLGAANSTGNRTFYLPPTDLSFINIGESDVKPNYYRLGLYKKTTLFHAAEIENASVLYNGHFDIGFVLVFILPLLVIALTYNLASFDKEHGTFGLLLSGSTSFKQIVTARFLFRGLVLFASSVLLIVLGIVFTGNFPAFATANFWILLVIIALYITFWCGVSYFVNSYQKSSSFNASILASLWLILVVLLPGFIKEFSTKIHPMPSKIALIAERREVADSIRNKSNEALNQFMEDHPDLVPNPNADDRIKNAIDRFSVDVAVNEKMKPMEEAFDKQLEQQEKTIENYRFLSPAVIMQKMVDYLSGNSKERYSEFNAQLNVFRENYRSFFAKKIFEAEKFKSKDYDQIPKANFVEKPIESSRFLFNIGFLVVISVILFYFASTKLDRLNNE